MTIEPPDERTVDPDPFAQFDRWYAAAVEATGDRAAAMTVATASPDGRPSARVVLLRGFDSQGPVFYTNYESRKGSDLAANPAIAALFYWPQLDAQIRIEGVAERVGEEQSDAYFAQRPRGHQLGAWASHQSAPIADRAELEAQLAAVEARFPGEVPRPQHWGGFRIRPDRFEFWKNRADRVHDRIAYSRCTDGWVIERLSP